MNNKWRNITLGWAVLLTVAVAFMYYYFSSRNYILEQKYSEYQINKKIDKPEFTPFIIYPENKDSLGNLSLSPENLENIRKHIEYIDGKVNTTIIDAKQEINNDINRLNTLATWWIGILTILGGLLPYVISIITKIDAEKAFDGKLKLAEESSGQAKNDAKEAKDKLAEFSIKYSGLDTKTEKAEQNATKALELTESFSRKAEAAEESATKANELATEAKNEVTKLKQVTDTTNALSKLRMIDAKKLEFIKDRLKYFTEQLELIEEQLKATLNQEDNFFTNDIVKENILSFYLSLRSFRTLFKERKVTQAIVEFHSHLESELSKGLNKNVMKSITEKLTELLTILKEN